MSTSSFSSSFPSSGTSASSSSSGISSSFEDSSISLSSPSYRQFSLDEINIATNNFDKTRIIGEGGEATVYKAEVFLNSKNQKTLVAVKHLDKNSTEFEKEIRIVSKIQYPYVVALLGHCNESGEKILIYEYMKNGSLSNYVKKDSACLSWTQRLHICLGAAYGLQHLHKETNEFRKGIIHRDVKPANILLDEHWIAKISDFGMFKLSDYTQTQSTMLTDSRKGTAGYIAPEYYMSRRITRKTDVYAFGVVLFEVLCRKKPWDRGDESYYLGEDEDLGVWARENVDIGIKSDISSDSLMAFTDAIGKCLQEDPSKRPTMDGVVQSLQLAIDCQELQSGGLNTDLPVHRRLPKIVEVEKFGFEEEVERLKRDKNVQMQELVRLRQKQQTTDNERQTMVERLQGMEQRQQEMMSFLAKAVNSPGFLQQVVQQQNESTKLITEDNKKSRLKQESSAGSSDGHIVKYQPVINEAAREMLRRITTLQEVSPPLSSSGYELPILPDLSTIPEILPENRIHIPSDGFMQPEAESSTFPDQNLGDGNFWDSFLLEGNEEKMNSTDSSSTPVLEQSLDIRESTAEMESVPEENNINEGENGKLQLENDFSDVQMQHLTEQMGFLSSESRKH